MRKTTESRKAGFTLTELLVVIGVGSVLAGVLLADLTQARNKLLTQACAANLKHWAMAIDMYTQDYDGTYFYAKGAYGPFDTGSAYGGLSNPYTGYLRGIGNLNAPDPSLRIMRQCPVVNRLFSTTQIQNGENGTGYSLTKPIARWINGNPNYVAIDLVNPGPYVYGPPGQESTLPTLQYVRNRSQFLLMMDGRDSVTCGGLVAKANDTNLAAVIKPVDRHGGAVNCLFGDFHVELVSTNKLHAQDNAGCGGQAGNPWFNMN